MAVQFSRKIHCFLSRFNDKSSQSYDFLTALQKFPSLVPKSYRDLPPSFHHIFFLSSFFRGMIWRIWTFILLLAGTQITSLHVTMLLKNLWDFRFNFFLLLLLSLLLNFLSLESVKLIERQERNSLWVLRICYPASNSVQNPN
jgi:hypothetical protein